MKKVRYDLLLAAILLLAAGVMWFFVRPAGEGGWAVVTVAGEEIARYELSREKLVTFGEEEYNVLRIKDGKAAVIEANCGDYTCVRTGEVSKAGETIICLPHELVVEIIGGETVEVDVSTN